VACVILLICGDVTARLELLSLDWRFAHLSKKEPLPNVIVIAIGDRSQAAWKDTPMAFWPQHYANLLRRSRALGAKVVGFDIIQTVDSDMFLDDLGVREEKFRPMRAFAAALEENENAVVLSNYRDAQGRVTNPASYLTAFPAVSQNIGFTELVNDADSVIRRAALYREDRSDRTYSFDTLLAAKQEALSPDKEIERYSRAQITDEGIGSVYFGFVNSAVKVIEASDLEAGIVTRDQLFSVKGAVVLVGVTFRDSSDWHRISGGKIEPGVLIHARVISSLLTGNVPRQWTPSGLVLAVLAAILIGFAGMVLSPFLVVSLSLLGALTWAGWTSYMFAHADVIVSFVPVVAAFALVPAIQLSVRSITEGQGRRKVEALFGKYLSPVVARYLLANSVHLGRGGVKCETTLMFLDLRDSSGMAEHAEPAQVVSDLNEFFDAVLPIVNRHGGLINKMLGDGFLALFGAPYQIADAPKQAIDAAQEIRKAVCQLNIRRARRGLIAFRYGCGIHQGMVLMGNVGTQERQDFTVIGDTVNVASRLEGIGKERGISTVVSEVAFQAAGCPEWLIGPEKVLLRGRVHEIDVYHDFGGAEVC